MIEWVFDPASRPTTVEQLKEQLGGAVTVDDSLNAVMFVETPLDVAVFRLPPKEMVQASVDRASSGTFEPGDYPLPDFYQVDAGDLGLDALTLFQSRVGDYSTGQCE